MDVDDNDSPASDIGERDWAASKPVGDEQVVRPPAAETGAKIRRRHGRELGTEKAV